MNTTLKSNKSSGAASMADLMAKYKSPFIIPRKGELLQGKVTKLTSSEILVDINAKTEAVVLEKDKKILHTLLSALKVGDEVSVSVLNPESDTGNPVVSLRRFIDDIAWNSLEKSKEKKEPIEVLITEIIKGGFLALTQEGLSGFLPNSYVSFSQNPQELIGKKIKIWVLELNRPAHKIIFSQKPVIDVKAFENATRNLKIGQKIETVVSNVTSFGVFVAVPTGYSELENIDGLLHISEIAWEKVSDITSEFTAGQKIEAVIVGFDKDAKRVDLSIKRLTSDPFTEIAKNFTVDKKVKGKVTKILPTGVVLDLSTRVEGREERVEGFMRKEKIPPTVVYKVDDEINATVSQVDKEKHRIVLVPVLLEKPIGYR